MQISTGHHQVADTLRYIVKQQYEGFHYEKVDILSYSYGKLERVISISYLLWIQHFPTSYHLIYDITSVREHGNRKRNSFYSIFFHSFFKRLIKEKHPDILFCTHALPSSLASRLKQQSNWNPIVVNVYTDYFVNRVWGIDGIDYHFAPSILVKNDLLKKGVAKDKIFVTGIPINPKFKRTSERKTSNKSIKILVTGGNLGVGDMGKIVKQSTGRVHFYILCGKNRKLFNKLNTYRKENITPFPYISSREKMNQLYDEVDGVLTKPGGVTVSECLYKRKPIFVSHVLPGQEKLNMEELLKLGVVIPVHEEKGNIEQQIIQFFHNENFQHKYRNNVENYHSHLKNIPLSILDKK